MPLKFACEFLLKLRPTYELGVLLVVTVLQDCCGVQSTPIRGVAVCVAHAVCLTLALPGALILCVHATPIWIIDICCAVGPSARAAPAVLQLCEGCVKGVEGADMHPRGRLTPPWGPAGGRNEGMLEMPSRIVMRFQEAICSLACMRHVFKI